MAKRNLYLALVFLFISSDILAHHSRADFTGDVIELTGELIDFSWRIPSPVSQSAWIMAPILSGKSRQALSRPGYSRGHLEGNTLMVETDHITAPAFNGGGNLQSDKMHIVERFTLSENQSRLDYHMVMTDPEAFTEPAMFESCYLALGRDVPEDLSGSNCG